MLSPTERNQGPWKSGMAKVLSRDRQHKPGNPVAALSKAKERGLCLQDQGAGLKWLLLTSHLKWLQRWDSANNKKSWKDNGLKYTKYLKVNKSRLIGNKMKTRTKEE